MIKEHRGKVAGSEGQVVVTEVGCGKTFLFYTKNNRKPLDSCEQEEVLSGLYFRIQKGEAVVSHAFLIHSFLHLFSL